MLGFFCLILTWIIVFLMTRKTTFHSRKWTEKDSFELKKSYWEHEYKKVVEGARSGDMRSIRLKLEYEESPEFKELGLTPVNL